MKSWSEILANDRLISIAGKNLNRTNIRAIGKDHPNDIFFRTLSELVSPEDYITVHTSGSTGSPTPLKILKEKLLASALTTSKALDLKEGTVLALCLSCDHIGGIMMLVRAIALNAQVIRLPVNSNPLKVLDEDQRVDLIAMVPMQVKNALKDERTKNKLKTISNVIIGGAAADQNLIHELKDFPNPIYSTFGMTETVSHFALRRLSGITQDHFECIGPTTVSIDHKSCLIVNAPHLTQRPIHSNDIVELIDDKRFRWLGRFDNVINSGGIKLNPEALEAKISTRINGRYFFASKPDKDLGEALILYVEGKERTIYLKDLLNKYELPREIVFLNEFKEAANGKIDRRSTADH